MSKGADFLGKGWKFPVTAWDGKIAMAEGDDCIKESIMMILGTGKGERVMRPDFGCNINDLVFEVNNTGTTTLIGFHVREALRKWEPRIEVLNIDVFTDEEERNKLNINIEYLVRASNRKANLVYPFYLIEGSGL